MKLTVRQAAANKQSEFRLRHAAQSSGMDVGFSKVHAYWNF